MDENLKTELSGPDFVRLANNFYTGVNYPTDYNRIALDSQLSNYIASHRSDVDKKYKVAFTFICLNPLYWQFAAEMVKGARQFFLPGHDTDFFFWTDIPETKEEIIEGYKKGLKSIGVDIDAAGIDLMTGPIGIENKNMILDTPSIINGIANLRNQKDIHLIPTEPIEWPYPTLLRYNLFLQQEEKLKEYDYIFYCDIDMKFVNVVGDEILGNGLTGAQHPMYALRKEYIAPYEPNPESQAYIHRPGQVTMDNTGKPRFMPLYYGGGFQGGKSDEWIKAMKEMRTMTDKDMIKNYIPIWNDESIWNRYLFDNPASITLTPSYIYPDSLIDEYYTKVWGCNYVPRLITITKWFTLSKQGGSNVAEITKST